MCATQHKPVNDASNARMYRCCCLLAAGNVIMRPIHGMRQDALRHDIFVSKVKDSSICYSHAHDDKASTDFVRAPRCWLHDNCVVVVITVVGRTLNASERQSV